jgi:hypothetical protein
MMLRTFRVLFVLWAGSLWSLAAWVAITVFHMLGDAGRAGPIAARLFGIETYLGLALAGFALALPSRHRLGALYAAVALLAANEWILKPVMTTARAEGRALGLGFVAWHGVSEVLYLGACLCALAIAWRESYRPQPSGSTTLGSPAARR